MCKGEFNPRLGVYVFNARPRAFSPKVSLDMLKPVKGTDYTKISDSRGYPWKGFYLSAPLTNGNTKLGKGVLSFDLLAVRTCPNCADCREKCYARKNENLRPQVFNKHLFNTLMALDDLYALRELIKSQLHYSCKHIVRIHSSGDFFSQAYLNMWVHIAKWFPNIRFYGYTKTRGIFDFSEADKTHNLNIVDSYLSDGSINFGDDDFLREKCAKFPNLFVCPVTLKTQGAVCMRTCCACLHEKTVAFKEH